MTELRLHIDDPLVHVADSYPVLSPPEFAKPLVHWHSFVVAFVVAFAAASAFVVAVVAFVVAVLH